MKIEHVSTQRVLSPTQIQLSQYVINPYRGCELACLYCYSRENKNIKKSLNQCLGIKINAPEILGKELRIKKPKRVLLGSTTECFQPQELKYKITEKILLLLNKHNIPYTILTKSDLINDYIDLISKNKKNKIYFTFNFHCDSIMRIFEDKSPDIKKRLSTINTILKNNISLRIHIGPFIPLVSSLKDIFSLIPKKVTEIDVELYNKTQGNFSTMLARIKKYMGKGICIKIKDIYSSEKKYLGFARTLKSETKALTKNNTAKIYYIVPKFNSYYDSEIDYEESIL